MPVLNERAYLRRAVETVLAQDVAAPTELILALAPSTDGTTELARELAADDRIVLVDNPEADIPIGLNRAIRAGRVPDDRARRRALRAGARLHDAARSRRSTACAPRTSAASCGRRSHAVPARGRARLQLPHRPRRRCVPRRHAGGRGGVGLPRRDAPRRARRGRTLRRDHPPRRGLGAEPPHPPRRLPRLVRSGAGRHVLAARELDAPGPAVLGDGPVARRARAPLRPGQLAALLRAARARRHPRPQPRRRQSCRRPACSADGGRSRHPSSTCR